MLGDFIIHQANKRMLPRLEMDDTTIYYADRFNGQLDK